MKATDKMIRYALYLLSENGYTTSWMDASMKAFGATMRERNGKVADWLQEWSHCKSVLDALAPKK